MPNPVSFPQTTPLRLEHRRIINDTSIRSIKPPNRGTIDYFDDLTPGLSLRITANDIRTWSVFYRDKHGRQKRLALGRYPSVKLVDARQLAHDAQKDIAHGGDPADAKRAAREVLTFGDLAKKYLDDYAKPRKKSWAEDERRLNVDLLPRWRTRPASELRAEDLIALLTGKVRDGSPVAANRLRALVSRMFTFAVEQRLVAPNCSPVFGVKKPTKEKSRDRVLTEDEIRRLWQACETQNAYICAWFRLRLVTAQRGGELLQMRWQDIERTAHFWSIPGEFVKNGQAHRVYLNALARAVLDTVPRSETSVWVFPESLMGDYKHVARRLAQSTRANIVRESKNEPGRRDVADFRGHDLRRTAASLMASGGVPRFVISRILNHSEESDITSVYDRYGYDTEKKAAMEYWNRRLNAILKGGTRAVARFKM